MIIEYDDSEKAIEQLNKQSKDVFYWDGWTICQFSPNPAAMYDKAGVFKDAVGWGFLYQYDVKDNGTWEVNFDR